MSRRWRGRTSVLAIAIAGALLVAAAGGAVLGSSGAALRISSVDGTLLERVAIPDDGFVLRYRNSLYGTPAEERFVVEPEGGLRLVELAAEQLAVLEEYYAVDEPPRRIGDGWVAPTAHDGRIDRLTVAATDLGQRTLAAGDRVVELWRLVDDAAPMVVIEVER